MMKGLLFQQQQGVLLDENMSNLTSASGEAVSVSSGNRIEIGAQQKYFVNTAAAPQNTQPAVKKRRNLPGNPDPDAEIIALSPKTLMATNRFICEICNKGFQRDQNLQLHRRGHNLPWKLKQRSNKEVIRKKVYVCPEPSCVHHDPSRALGDLTGIKKHFFRKHGEKKWKCDKCSKKYAVQSDWKAHSKTCGTREYRCDCGTLFSRRDSFITHRAFCDALAEESARAISANPLLSHQQNPNNVAAPTGIINSSALSHLNNFQTAQFANNNKNPHQNLHTIFPLKKEQQIFNLSPEIPPWLSSSSSSSIFSTRLDQSFTQTHQDNLAIHHHQDPNPNPNPNNNSRSVGPTLIPYQPTISAHMSATALLQKAAQMGATISSNKSSTCSLPAMHRPHQVHMSDNSGKNSNNSSSGNFGFNNNNNNMCSREEMASTGFVVHNLAAFGNKASASAATIGATSNSNVITTAASGVPVSSSSSSSLLLHDMVNSLSSGTGFEGTTSFEDYAFGGILNSNKDLNETLSIKTTCSENDYQSTSGGNNNIGEGLTRDFLGLRSLSQSDILNIAALGNCINTTRDLQNQPQKPWQG